MTISERNRSQINESQSDLNRYYFFLKYGRLPIDNSELLLYYIEAGGSADFAKKLAKEDK